MSTKSDKQAVDITAEADSKVGILQAAFLATIVEIRNYLMDEQALELALANKDIDTALISTQIEKLEELLFGIGMEPDMFIFSSTVQDTFASGAKFALSQLSPELQKKFSYDPLGERAVQFMREDGLKMAKELTASSTAGVRLVIVRSLSENTSPAKMAKEIRQLIGLTEDSSQAVLNFRRQLESRQLLGFTPPDERRLNAVEQAMVRRHMKEGHFTDEQIDSMVERYYRSLVNKRALDIARTESLNAVNNGQQELWEQALDGGFFDDNKERKFWVTAGDDKVRPTHIVIPAMNPGGVKIRSKFITPFGAVTGPGDRNSGLINCRCVVVISSVV